jgi:hypothetical protein
MSTASFRRWEYRRRLPHYQRDERPLFRDVSNILLALRSLAKHERCFSNILPGLADRPIQCLPDLTPAAWVAQHLSGLLA